MRRLLSPALIAAVFLLDRAAKARVLAGLFHRSVEVAPFFRLTYAENTGVSFGLFRDKNLFFLAFSAALVAGLLALRRRIAAHGRLAEAGLALVLGGALGNLYDRIAYGHVVDFLDFSFFPAVFNVADSAITVGALLMAWGMRERAGQKSPRPGE
ncbi:MAG: signal peptidase II [Elusimicrobia bacterium]|nr:signal peptidase II [Elusimicrobiota bacterium]